MFASFITNALLTVGCTLLPVILANLAFLEVVPTHLTDAKRNDWLQQHAGTRYGLLTVAGTLALAIMLKVIA